MSTILTWCENCGEDMHVNGGGTCNYCGKEFCYGCLEGHEHFCEENPDNKNNEEEE